MIHHILVPLDRSALAELALAHAESMARAFGADVTLLAVEEHGATDQADAFVDPFAWHSRRQEATVYLDRMAQRLQAAGVSVDTEIRDGPPAEIILQTAQERRSALIVLTSHGRGGVTSFPISGTAQKVLIAASTSILVVRSAEPQDRRSGKYKLIMAPTDGSHRADWALHMAARVAQAHGAELLIVHVVPVPEHPRRMPPTRDEQSLITELVRLGRRAAEDHLDAVRRQIATDDLVVRVRVEESFSIAPTIDRAANDSHADLVVIGAHGGGCQDNPSWRYGSVAASLISFGTTPLLVCQDLPQHPEATSGRHRHLRTPVTVQV
jgi:nucleotide-binding universal stress UspA family protein